MTTEDTHLLNWLAALVLPLAYLASLLEALFFRRLRGRRYNWRLAGTNLVVHIGNLVSEQLPIALALPGAWWLYEHRLFEPHKWGWWSYLVLFVVIEFTYYWTHRLGHRVRWFWVGHGVHHTSNELTVLAALRTGWTHRLMANYVLYAPILLLGFHPFVMMIGLAAAVGYQFWLHTAWTPKLGFLEGILNTPSAHRVHHGGNLEYLDCNYGGLTLIFDRIFGTYRAERDEVPVRYGLVEPLNTNNPFKIALFQFEPLIRDLRGARSVREVLGYLLGPPGWKPAGQGNTTESMRRAAGIA